MKILFVIQGCGKGHFLQAVAAKEQSERLGHHVDIATGRDEYEKSKSFVQQLFPTNKTILFDTFTYVFDNLGSVSNLRTFWHNLKKMPVYIEELIFLYYLFTEYDLIVNFYEPMVGLVNFFFKNKVKTISVGHQYLLNHSTYVKEGSFEEWVIKQYTKLTAYGSYKIFALSIYPSSHLEEENFNSDKRIQIIPSILRKQLYKQPYDTSDYYVAYVAQDYLHELLSFSRKNRGIYIECFCNYKKEDCVDLPLSFVLTKPNSELFLARVKRCIGIITNGGFETLSEAVLLGKPIFMRPIDNHFEQRMNVADGVRWGVARKVDNLKNLDLNFKHSKMLQEWLKSGEEINIFELL